MDILLEALGDAVNEHQDVLSTTSDIDEDISEAPTVEDWIKVWDPSSSVSMDAFLNAEPKRSIKKTNKVKCTLLHAHDSPPLHAKT